MRKWIIASVILVSTAALLFVVTPGKSRLKSYYSGDAMSYQNNVYVATTNTGSLEIFKLNNRSLDLFAKTKPYNYRFHSYDEFYDAKLVIEQGELYAYAVSNYTLYKYRVLDGSLDLVKKTKNSYWEWYNRVDKFGDDIVTISAKGIKVFNSNLEIVVAHDFKNESAPYNISGTNDRFLLSIEEESNSLKVYDKESREVISTILLNFKHDKGNRRAYQDAAGYIYVVDDYYAKKFNVAGELLGSFRHLDFQGFDMNGSGHTNYVYFSNGVGVVKLDKQMDLADYAWTGNLGDYGGWAMGLDVVYNNGDKVVVFNNTNILVLDENLNKVASVSASEEANKTPFENLFLNLDKNKAAPNSEIYLSGGGYFPYEQLTITFEKERINAVSDNQGRFDSIITVPQLRSGGYDIKVEGVDSDLTYSISFEVE